MPGKRRSGLAIDRRSYVCPLVTFIVTYNGNNNTSGNVPIDGSSIYRSGLTVIVLGNSGSPALAKSGFAFAGWNTEANGSGTSYAQGSTFIIKSNVTLYAQWIPTYTVTYNGNNNNDGNVPIDSSSPYITNSTVTVLGNSGSSALTKIGFAFAGWNTAANGSGTSYSQGNTFVITANTTLYVRWTPTYTVTYNGNDSTFGNVPTSPSTYLTDSSVNVLGNSGSPVLTRTGYTFSGWNTAANGSGTSYSQGNTFVITANTILYARWIQITYTVTYNGNGNTNTDGIVPTDGSSPYVTGTNVVVLGNSGSPALAKSGSTFAGWNTAANGSGTSYSVGSSFAIAANTTLYARWIVNISPPTLTLGVGGNQAAYILFTQSGSVTNYEYSTDNGETFRAFDPPQTYSPVEINTLSSDGTTRLTLGTTYTVILKAVNSGLSSSNSNSVNVVPVVTSLVSDSNRLIYLDANNSSSYSGTGNTWTNLVPGRSALNATLYGSPTFNTSNSNNKYFDCNTESTGQFARINENLAINPEVGQPFTIQLWVRINNVGSGGGSLVSKMFDESRDYDGYNFNYVDNNINSVDDNNTLQLHLNGSGRDDRFNSITGILRNGWTLYTANVQFGGQNNIFVNGRQVLTAASTESNTNSNNQNLTILSGFAGDAECDIGQFYYYNRELSVTEVIQNYDASKPRYL